MSIAVYLFILVWLLLLNSSSLSASGLELLGQVNLPTGLMYENTEVGGLSSISYVSDKNVYYVISDDRSFRQPARYYRFIIDFSGEKTATPSVKITGVTLLLDSEGETFKAGSLDPEGLVAMKEGKMFISSEGVTKKNIPPFIALYSSTGQQLEMMQIGEAFMPSPHGGWGVRENMGFEALTLDPDGKMLTSASENALLQDGPQATLSQSSPCRLIIFDTESGELINEYIYYTDPVPEPPVLPGALRMNGLVELLALDDEGSYLALERAYAVGAGFNIRLYLTVAQKREGGVRQMALSKELILNFNTLGIPLDNLEGMSFGPDLSDGRKSLVVISDNNFSRDQFTQILIFAIDESAIHPTVLP